jgi:hypothetical protein
MNQPVIASSLLPRRRCLVAVDEADVARLLLQILVHDIDQFFRCRRPQIIGSGARIDHVLANMVLDHFGDKTVEGASARRRLLEYIRAFPIGVDCPFDRLNLTAQPLDPIQQLGFFLCDMTHGMNFLLR